MLPLKLADDVERKVKEVLSRGIPQTPVEIDAYPDLSLFSEENLKESGYSIRIYGKVEHEGQQFFVGPKIEQRPS